MDYRIEAHSIPAADEEFARFVKRCCERAGADMDIGQLVTLVRELYPRAVVRPQSSLAQVDHVWVWYVYRDG